MVVKDTGIGIPPAYHQKIFNHFYRVQEDNGFEGMGIGLSLSRELVELHQGKIWVESSPGEGASFFVFLPLDRSHFSDDQIAVETLEIASNGPTEAGNDRKLSESLEERNPKIDKPVILFIEDNPDMQEYIKHEMEEQYILKGAGNGKNGLQEAYRLIPDIIITDIMMPGMNGMEVCRQLKEDRRTRHIPVIMLTARATNQDKLGGLSTGADDYMIKPFDIQELKYKTRNQLQQLERLQERYLKAFLLNDPSAEITSRDEVFLSGLLEVVSKNLEDPSFSVLELSRQMGVSRTQLFRKLKALTGQQPNEFIRSVRMKKASELLKKGSSNVSEIAYDLGFNSLSYFSRCFKEVYHITPTEYMKKPSQRRDIDLSGS
jgi:DNA-binding response OmpR family regulator